MNKRAITEQPIHPILAERWSPRAFSEQPVPDGVLGSLLEAARWAPSSRNEQPWRFVVVERQNVDAHTALTGVLSGNNRLWAGSAPLLLVAVAAAKNTRDASPNAYAWYDLGQAVAHLTFQASADGLVLHQMGGFDKTKARVVLALPDDYDPVAVIAIGYPGEVDALPAPLQEREKGVRTRRALAESVSYGSWGESRDS
ncbi:MAG: nitroreductase family protein [Caldilineaceae bacterium]|nr:nitroreductase family protein [Caldilineaceae bacterium]